MSTQVVPYELQRVEMGGVISRGPRPEADGTLRDRVRHLSWSWKAEGEEEPRKPQRGPILSGEKLVDSAEFKAILFAQFPDGIGGEMEGVGLYAAAARRNLPWLIVKAICDWGVGKDTKGQPLAAKNACACVVALLHEPTLRAEDFGRTASAAESRAERAFRDQTRRSRFQELSSKIRDAVRRQKECVDDQAEYIRKNLAALRDPGVSADITDHLNIFEAARVAAFEVVLNAYNDAAAAYLHNDIDRKQFLATFEGVRLFWCSGAPQGFRRGGWREGAAAW